MQGVNEFLSEFYGEEELRQLDCWLFANKFKMVKVASKHTISITPEETAPNKHLCVICARIIELRKRKMAESTETYCIINLHGKCEKQELIICPDAILARCTTLDDETVRKYIVVVRNPHAEINRRWSFTVLRCLAIDTATLEGFLILRSLLLSVIFRIGNSYTLQMRRNGQIFYDFVEELPVSEPLAIVIDNIYDCEPELMYSRAVFKPNENCNPGVFNYWRGWSQHIGTPITEPGRKLIWSIANYLSYVLDGLNTGIQCSTTLRFLSWFARIVKHPQVEPTEQLVVRAPDETMLALIHFLAQNVITSQYSDILARADAKTAISCRRDCLLLVVDSVKLVDLPAVARELRAMVQKKLSHEPLICPLTRACICVSDFAVLSIPQELRRFRQIEQRVAVLDSQRAIALSRAMMDEIAQLITNGLPDAFFFNYLFSLTDS